LDKYAVRVGGARNHRISLADSVMIKDNHIAAAGSITKAVKKIKSVIGHTPKVEVETTNLEEVKEALQAGADIIMLDNMSHEQMKEAIAIIDGRAETECSGNITKENVKAISDLGVDYVSSGALTHSSPILDVSLKNLRVL
jgi:nicotinate-nucleotide pyrophosphorylase (carboxylating)